MTITVELPDALQDVIFANGQEPARAVLEAMALEGHRTERLSEWQIQQLLGFETRMEVHGFLKEHEAYMHYTMEDYEQDCKAAMQDAQQMQRERETASELSVK